MRRRDATAGTTVGWWTIVRVESHAGRPRAWVRCRCGVEQWVRVYDLPPKPSGATSTRCRRCASRHTTSFIGDLRSLHPLYETWRTMIRRCHDPEWAGPDWRYYGGRGISVCDRWRDPVDGFWRFAADVGPRPPGTTLDRIDVDGDYTPGNVRWATGVEQAANRRPISSPF